MKTHLLRITVLIASQVALAVSAENQPFEYVQCFAGEIQTLKHSDGNVANSAILFGLTRAITPGSFFDNMTAQCVGLFGRAEGIAFAHEYCEYVDKDGDVVFLRYERQGTKGTVRSLGSTGKYQSLNFEGSYETVSYSQGQGMVRGCVHSSGQWVRR